MKILERIMGDCEHGEAVELEDVDAQHVPLALLEPTAITETQIDVNIQNIIDENILNIMEECNVN